MNISILTISDTRNYETDGSGKKLKELCASQNWTALDYNIVKDEIDSIVTALKNMIKNKPAIILTSGGTGISSRDVTPEATKKVIDKEVPGIAEAIRSFSIQKTKNAMLSRGIAGVAENTLIVNLPGSEKAAAEIFPYIYSVLEHSVKMLGADYSH